MKHPSALSRTTGVGMVEAPRDGIPGQDAPELLQCFLSFLSSGSSRVEFKAEQSSKQSRVQSRFSRHAIGMRVVLARQEELLGGAMISGWGAFLADVVGRV